MNNEIKPVKHVGGTLKVPGDKSIAHRVALLSILSKGEIVVRNFPDSEDCNRSLNAAKLLGKNVSTNGDQLLLSQSPQGDKSENILIDCGNSGTTARLLSGLIAGSKETVTLAGDESLSKRPMQRIVEPLESMGAELYDTEGHLPVRIKGTQLLPFDYTLPVASAQVKSALLLAGLSSQCTVTIREKTITRDHTEIMLKHLGANIEANQIKAEKIQDPDDPRKTRLVKTKDYKRETILSGNSSLGGGEIDIPGDISTASFFLAAAACIGGTVTVQQVGLNPTRTAFLDYLKAIGCDLKIENRQTISGELRGDVTVTGGKLKARKISGDTTAALIDEIPIVAVLASRAKGTTVIRDAQELRHKESDRLEAVAENLTRMGVSCGLLENGLAIEGGKELLGADLKSYSDHRIVMAFSIAAKCASGPSRFEDTRSVAVSCPKFFDMLEAIT